MSDEERPRLSVVVPTCEGDAWLPECLASLARQTLPSADYEVVVVRNGPPSAAHAQVTAAAAAFPNLRVRLVESSLAGAGAARNAGLDAAAGEYVTFVDDDDRVTLRYLEVLLAGAAPGVVHGVLAAEVYDDDFAHPRFDFYYVQALRPFLDRPATNLDLATMTALVCAKVVETELARHIRFDETLASGEDTVFWTSVVATGARLRLVDGGPDAVYHIRRRPGSVMQRGAAPTWERNVERWVRAAATLARLEPSDWEARLLVSGQIRSLLLAFVRPYLIASPQDGQRVRDRLLAERSLQVPWGELYAGVPLPETTLSSGGAPRLSVVVPTYQGDGWLGACLDSLAAQTLPRSEYEIVVVRNGPETAAARIVAQKVAEHAGLRARYAETADVGASAARNHGLDLALGEYVTFVDDDDRVAPRFLETLLSHAGADVVAGTLVGFVHDGAFDRPSFDNYIAGELEQWRGRPARNIQLGVMVAYTWAKVVATEHARRIRFDESLPNGQDVVFWTTLVATLPVRLVLAAGGPDTVYLYHVREGSLMQVGAVPTWEHRVERRIRVLAALQAVPARDAESDAIRQRMMRDHSLAFIRPYLLQHPGDVARVDVALRRAGLHDAVPWAKVYGGLARSLAFVEPGGPNGSGERLAERAVVTDVVTVAAPDSGATALQGSAAVLADHVALAAPDAVTWDVLAPLVGSILEMLARHEAERGAYVSLYSRSAGPLEHLLAAMVKLARPDLGWTAELIHAAGGAAARGARAAVAEDGVLAVLEAGLAEVGCALDALPETMGELGAFVVRALADEVVEEPAREDADESHLLDVSVIVPTHRGDAWLGECLDTLAVQTVAAGSFEIVIVQNGPRTGTRELVAAWCAGHPDVLVQYLESDVASVSHARNLGLDTARGRYVTFVDDDDRVGPRFLEGLLTTAAPSVISVALGAWVYHERWADPAYDDYTASVPLRFAGTAYSNQDVVTVLHPVWAKLVLTSLARTVRFDETLSGYAEDTVFWLRALDLGRLRIVLSDLSTDAAYLYRVREGSLTQWGAGTSWAVHVEAPLRALVALREPSAPATRRLAAVLARAPFAKMNEYLRAHPGDTGRVAEALRERGIADVPWQILCAGIPTELALVGSLTGPLDSWGRTVGDRLVQRGRPADALTYASPGADSTRPLAAAAGLVGRHIALTGPASVSWDLLGSLVQNVLGTLASLEEESAYGAVFSHAAGPLEHLVAAMLRLARPGLRWEAELVEPMAGADVPGLGAAVRADWLLDVFGAGLAEAGFATDEVPSTMGAFAELMACALADEVTFATEWQREEVLSRLDAALAESARDRSRVLHPVVAGGALAVSVIVPTYKGDAWLEDSLRSLAAQSLCRDAFEILVVRNGPPTRAAEIVAGIAGQHEGLKVRLLSSEAAGVSRARNLGLSAALGEYVVFVDDDDRVGSRYLEGLLAVARRDAVGIAPMYEARGGEPIRDNWLSRPLLHGARSRVELGACLHSAWAKIVSTDLARGVGFDPSLTYGEDTLFWTTLVLRHDLRLVAAPFRDETAYIWERRLGSATTAAATFEVSVEKQLDVIAALARLDAATPELAAVRDDVVRRFQGWAAGWLDARPRDLRRFVTVVQARDLDILDWTPIHPELGRRLTPVEATV